MANYSYTDITIKINNKKNEPATREDLQNLYNELYTFVEGAENNWINPVRLQKDDSSGERAKYSTATILQIELSEDILNIALEGRWCSPSQLFIDLCKKHQLSLHYIDRENGCNFTHVVIIENGKVKVDKQDNYISPLAVKYCIDEVYDRIIEDFEDSDYYDEGIKKYLDKDEEAEDFRKVLVKTRKYKDFLRFHKKFYPGL